MKILIVEDDVMVALSMDEALSEAGHDVVGLARDEELAIRYAEETRLDLALIDLRLVRGTSGADVARKLREQFGIPAIFVSGSPGDCHKVGFHIGVLGCLSKPFTPKELVRAVEATAAILRRQSPGRVPSNLDFYHVS